MRRILLLTVSVLAILVILTSNAYAEKLDSAKLIGKISWDEWKNNCGWDLTTTYEYFYPDTAKINEIKGLLKKFNVDSLKFLIFATTSCNECKENLPKLMKILEELQISDNSIELYGLNENLEEPSGVYKKYDISTTPLLLIIYKNELVVEISYPYIWIDSLIEVFESLE